MIWRTFLVLGILALLIWLIVLYVRIFWTVLRDDDEALFRTLRIARLEHWFERYEEVLETSNSREHAVEAADRATPPPDPGYPR